MKAVIIHHEAEAEIIIATQFYEAKSEKVAARFVDEIERALRAIAASPQRSPFFSRSVRRYLLRRFPYGLLYQVYEEHVYILVKGDFVSHAREGGHPQRYETHGFPLSRE